MSIILLETHHKLVRKVRKRAFIIHGILVLMLLASVLFPWISKIETDLIRASYGVVRLHLVNLESRYALLEILRNKPLSAGQALEIADVLIEESRICKVPVPIILGVMNVESEFRADSVSIAGARGLMQVMPAIWSQYAESDALKGQMSRHSPALNVRIAIRYLGDLFKQYGDVRKALKVYGGFVSKSPDRYVNAVMAKAEQYQVQIGEDDGGSVSRNVRKDEKVPKM
jgi:soluble lytic murein transglycosylase-like protein